ncbi:MAG: chorismate synthase [Bryobacteraceae bacterium]|nr:chorismate synthase [Bryobacteraceae bacterium]
MLRFETAGESHGEALVATLTGLPASVPISNATISRELWRRQQGYGRGGRMKIEKDTARILSGVRHSITTGAPIAILIENRDWQNWTEVLPVEAVTDSEEKKKPLTRPRPGHADLAGAIKYNLPEARYILERASARETAARVALGALAKQFLAQFGIEVLSHVLQCGSVRLGREADFGELKALAAKDEVLLRESEVRLSALAGSTDEVVFEFDGDGRYLNVWTRNEALLFRPAHELIGRTLDRNRKPNQRQRHQPRQH